MSQMSTDQLNLGPADDPESCSVSSNGPEVFSLIYDHSPPAQCDQPGLPVHPDLYLGPEDDLMAGMHDQSHPAQPDMLGLAIHPDLYLGPDEDIMTEIPDPSPPAQPYHPDVPIHPDLYLGPDEDFMPEFPAIAKYPERDLPHPDVTYEELLAMVQDLRPFESYNHIGIQSIQDRVRDYKQRHGHIPDPSIQQLLEAERPFRTAWAETSDKLRRADEDLWRLQRAECLTSKMLKSPEEYCLMALASTYSGWSSPIAQSPALFPHILFGAGDVFLPSIATSSSTSPMLPLVNPARRSPIRDVSSAPRFAGLTGRGFGIDGGIAISACDDEGPSPVLVLFSVIYHQPESLSSSSSSSSSSV
ncbi:uncharacterized protein EDB93DRAFT_1254800 [Suillus bovinus]|uniref:uncharacterized protein n=1 Tax=Suillus bovinus TaxID=48563 RepID=UPI001B85D737|nr:uncharacterized protein EDB93DRAFT_1254800 [Suillus bovinus]KAG2133587.1 hypothetical protein EDB93DRAFT_1254800 [Suillus bovinus]